MGRRSERGILAAWAVVVACLFVFAAPAVATTWVAQNVPLTGLEPAAGAAPHESLTKVSCAAVGSCVAVGSYTDVNGARQGLIETLSDGKFTATTAPLAGLNPAAAGNPQVALFDVRCPVVGWCVADGQYTDGSKVHLLAETLSNGSWSATTLPNPAGSSNPDVGVESMSCAAEGACVLVGAYASSGQNQPLAERLASGTWTAQTPPINTLSPAGTEGQLFDVSCSSSTACTAVGDTDGGQGALIETSSGGSWVASSPSLAGLTPKAVAGGGGALTNVSCSSSGACSEVGTYEDQTFATQGLVVTGGSATAVDLSTIKPPPFTNPLFSFEGVACFATCIAMGSYTFPQGQFSGRQTTVTTFSGRGPSTTTASLSGLSPAPSSPAGPGYNQASCADATDCVAVGQYGAANGTIRSILETVAGSSSSAAAPSLAGVTPAPASSDPDDTLSGVSCPASGACVAVGSYIDASETAHAMVVTPKSASVSVSLSPGTITADGQATTTATAKVSSGAGAMVSFSSSDAGQKIGPVHDNGNGTYTATITASEKVGTATIAATDESDLAKPSAIATLTQEPPKVRVSVTPSSIAADGRSTAIATVTLTGVHGEPVADQDVVVTTAGPASAGAVSGGAGGNYTATITSTHSAGSVTVTGTDLSVDPSASAHATLKTKAAPPPPKKGCVVPKLRGDSLGAAKRALRRAHCALGKVTRKASGKVRKGHVISSRPGKDAHRKRGARIAIVLSRGKH